MTGFLSSIKDDLLDRRLLPLVALVLVALVAAIGYAAFGGGSSTPTPPAAVTGPAVASSGLATSQTTPETTVAEVTSGVSTQHHGATRNPFTPLPEAKAKTAAAPTTTPASSSTTSSSSSTSGSETSSSSSGSSSTTPSTPSSPATPSKPKTVYHVAVLFGQLPVSALSPLTAHENLKLLTPLPSSAQALIVFRGVTAGGKSATFTLVSEAILHGPGACLPSPTQCEAIDLRSGQSEQLEYLSASGAVVSYELQVVSIASEKASVAAFKDALHGSSKAGRELLSSNGLQAIPFLHYSATAGVLVFARHGAFAARAHSARRRHGR
ncbi:MAG TPA: hypothetical protein VIH71_15550 [Solirubrobacteraceae bacterium]